MPQSSPPHNFPSSTTLNILLDKYTYALWHLLYFGIQHRQAVSMSFLWHCSNFFRSLFDPSVKSHRSLKMRHCNYFDSLITVQCKRNFNSSMHLFVLGAPILFLCQQKLSQLEKLPTWREKNAIFGHFWLKNPAISNFQFKVFVWLISRLAKKQGRALSLKIFLLSLCHSSRFLQLFNKSLFFFRSAST